jgi:geranylgeranylglycerol-phosphate geranylgeranyltransferase
VRAWSKFRDSVALVRAHNCLLAAASVFIGGFLARASVGPGTLAGAGCAFFICAGGYALNDLYDLEADTAGKPWRPLPSGRVGRRFAAGLVGVTWAIGAVLSALAGSTALLFAISWMGLLWLYCSKWKSAGLSGHLLVSAVSSSGFVLGAVLAGNVAAGLFPFLLGFVFHFAREVVKGMADREGDARAGVSTLAVRAGLRKSGLVGSACIAGVMAISLLPLAAGLYGILYAVPVLAIQPLLLLCMYNVMMTSKNGGPQAEIYARVAGILKALMPVGLLAFVLGGI